MAEIPTSSIAGSRVLESLFGGSAGKQPKSIKKRTGQNLFEYVYWPVLLPSLLLVAFGLLVVWSASLTIAKASFVRQLIGTIFGVLAAIVVWHFDYRRLANLTRVLLIIDVVLMVAPLIPGLGYESNGMTGWVRIPFIGLTLQPSELAKLVTIYLMAALTAQYNGRIDNLREYLKLCFTLSVPFVLILIQPDLGTGLIILFIGAMIIIAGGAKRTWVISTLVIMIGLVALVIITSMTEGLPHILKDYQLKRLIVFVDPSVDPIGDGYNLQQAKIAVGSGGLFGKGIGNASQAGQGFLPEAHTDFVFALLAEEFGFIGACVLLGLFGWLMVSCIRLAQICEQPFAKLVVIGVVSMWCFQVLQNVGMCIGLMPITGIPLPFVSFGSSSMLAQLMAVGQIQSVWRYRQSPA